MKKIIFSILILVFAAISQAQSHRIVFQLSSEDTLVHKALMKNIGHVLQLAPDAKVEVVCHGPGLSMLVQEKSMVQSRIHELAGKGVAFVACEFTMKDRNVTKDKLVSDAGTVPGGIMEIVKKQEEGWSYIKPGF